jgi:hypothetical protein
MMFISWLKGEYARNSMNQSNIVYILVEERIYTKFNESAKMLFGSWLESEYARNSMNQPKSCLDLGSRANMHEIQWISQIFVYIVIGERIYTKSKIWTKMLFISWLKSEYARNSINQSKGWLYLVWKANMDEIQWICQNVVCTVCKVRICTKFNESAKKSFTLMVKSEYKHYSRFGRKVICIEDKDRICTKF